MDGTMTLCETAEAGTRLPTTLRTWTMRHKTLRR
jgi:hypothetical protein